MIVRSNPSSNSTSIFTFNSEEQFWRFSHFLLRRFGFLRLWSFSPEFTATFRGLSYAELHEAWDAFVCNAHSLGHYYEG